MKLKKTAAALLAAVMLLALAACGNGADIPLSKLSFGMSEEEVKAVIKSAPDEEYSDEMFTAYRGKLDIAEGLWVLSFYCGGGGLYEIFLGGDDMPREECFAARDELMKNLSGLYGVPESGWEIQNDGRANFLTYRNGDGQSIQLYVRLFEGEQDGSASILLILQSYDNMSVIPKN